MELCPAWNVCVYSAVKALSSSAETSFDSVMVRSARSPLEVNVAHPANIIWWADNLYSL